MAEHNVIVVEVDDSVGQLSTLLKTVEESGHVVRLMRNGKAIADLTPATDAAPLPIFPELAGVVFNADPVAPLDDEDWPQDSR